MIIDTRHECVDFIARSIRKTAEWRLSLAKRFPGDARNTRAAERLAEIANEATELPDRIWEGLRPHFHCVGFIDGSGRPLQRITHLR